MLTQGFGESSPIADNDSDEGRERTRRVELKVTEASDVGADTGTDTGTRTGDTSRANDSSMRQPAPGAAAPTLSEAGTSAEPADCHVPEARQPEPDDTVKGTHYAAAPTPTTTQPTR